MKFKLLFIAILLASMSACAPQVVCPAYAVDDAEEKQTLVEEREEV